MTACVVGSTCLRHVCSVVWKVHALFEVLCGSHLPEVAACMAALLVLCLRTVCLSQCNTVCWLAHVQTPSPPPHVFSGCCSSALRAVGLVVLCGGLQCAPARAAFTSPVVHMVLMSTECVHQTSWKVSWRMRVFGLCWSGVWCVLVNRSCPLLGSPGRCLKVERVSQQACTESPSSVVNIEACIMCMYLYGMPPACMQVGCSAD